MAFVSWMALPLVLAWAEGAGLGVRGDTTCPSPAEVANRLGPMLPRDAAFPEGAWVELGELQSSIPGRLDVEVRLTLEGEEGEDGPEAVRRVQRVGTCADLAEAVAVVASAWATRYASLPVAMPSLPPPGLRDLSPRAEPPMLRVAPPERPRPVQFGIGAGTGVVGGGGGGLGFLLTGELSARRGWLVGRLALAGTSDRDLALSPGNVSWRRLLLLPSVGLAVGRRALSFEVGVGAAVGGTWVQGHGFAVNASDARVALGLAPGLRVARALTSSGPSLWLAVQGFVWLRPHELSVDLSGTSRKLPVLDGSVAVGMTFPLGI